MMNSKKSHLSMVIDFDEVAAWPNISRSNSAGNLSSPSGESSCSKISYHLVLYINAEEN